MNQTKWMFCSKAGQCQAATREARRFVCPNRGQMLPLLASMHRRSWLRAAGGVVALAGLFALGPGGCSAEDEVEPAKGLMLAIRTDMSIPEGVSSMRIEVLTNGVPKLLADYDLGPAPDKTSLPGTLALLPPADPTLPVKIRVVARTLTGKATVMREVTTTVPNDRLVMLPIGIQWLCWDSVIEDKADPNNPTFRNTTCASDETCIAGGCAPQKVDSAALPTFDPTQIFGGAAAAGAKGQCFDTVACFGSSTTEAPDSSCTLAAPPAGQEAKYNVALVLPPGDSAGICGDTSCLVPLERDDADGWKLEGNRVKLPPSVCQKLGSSIAAVAVSNGCTTKTSALPTCGPWSSVTSASGTFDGGPEFDVSVGDAGPDASLDSGSDAQDTSFEAPPADASLGKKCLSKTECGQLDCVAASSTALGGEGPPSGMCTLPCGGLPATYCGMIDPGAICHVFAPGAEYCLKGCTPGPVSADGGFDPNKCHGRPEMGCTLLTTPTGPASACLPTCAGTQHCDTGGSTNTACNPATGLCTKVAPAGATYGTSCTLADAGLPADGGDGGPASCAGICSPVLDPSSGQPGTFVCSGACVVNPDASCGWNGTGAAEAACMKGFVPNVSDLGDSGTCVELCDCQDFCSDPNMVCVQNPDFALAQKWGKDGYCTYSVGADGGPVSGLGC